MTPSNERFRRYLFPAIGAVAGALVALIVAASGFSAAGFLPALIMFLAVLALLVAIVSIWQSLRYAFGAGDTMAARIGERSMERETLEDEKAALLRSMSDLKFEKQIGKIAEGDFERLDAGLRARARAVMRILDDDVRPFREKAETLIQEKVAAVKTRDPYRGDAAGDVSAAPKKKKKKRTAAAVAPQAEREGKAEGTPREEAKSEEAKQSAPEETSAVAPPAELSGERTPREEATDSREEAKASEPEEPTAAEPEEATAPESAVAGLKCPSCDARNDADAAFCKKCGHRLEAEAGT